MTDEPRVRIVSDGKPTNTTVYIDGKNANGYITKVVWTVEPDRLATATITFEDVEVDVLADPE